MVVSLAFVNGFQKVVSEKVFHFWGHIRVQEYEPYKVSIAEEYPIQKNDTVEKSIAAIPDIRYFQTFATKSAILKSSETIEGILFKGVGKDYHFEAINPFLKKGHWPVMKDSGYSADIVISEYLASRLKTDVNQNIIVYFIQSGEERPRTRKLHISGIYKTGIEVYDQTFIVGDIRLIQRLNNWTPEMIGGYEVFLNDHHKMAEISEKIFSGLPSGWNSKTMKEIYPEIFDWLQLQDLNKYILLSVLTIVAIINMITCLIILVLERTRMIGVLKAMGASNWSIQKIFLFQGAYITLWGITLGMIIGIGLSLLQKYTGFITLNEEAYYMNVAPVEMIWWQVIAVGIGTFIICFTILLIPSVITRKIIPTKAIQFR